MARAHDEVTMITIYGAGAIGGLTGACLARAGEDVLLVDKVADHVEAMNRHGLAVSGGADFTAQVRACVPADLPAVLKGPLGLTFLAVKSQDTEAAIDVLAPLAGPDTVVVSLQNGMNPPRLAERLGADRVLGVFVSFPADWQGPGHIEHGGPGNVWVGELDGRRTARVERVRALLAHVAKAHATDNIAGYLWAKQIDSALLYAQATTDETMADVFGNRRYQPALIALVGEGVAVAAAAGVRLERFGPFEPLKLKPSTAAEVAEAHAVLDRFSAHQRTLVKVRSGPWRDMAVRKRPTEIEHMVGWVIEEGRRRGVPLPLNELLLRQVKEIETGARPRTLANLDELEARRQELYGAGIGPR
jgi:2-dehydropantoate 2-reductase